MRHWICSRNLCYKFKQLINRSLSPRGATIISDHPLHCSELQYHHRPSSSTSTLQYHLKRSRLGSCHLVHSFRYYHNTPIFLSIPSIDTYTVRSKFTTDTTIGRSTAFIHFIRPYSTNSTSVSPPPTPSTQGECLPSSVTDSQSNAGIQIPEPPTNCCMSGCANCVWITYAQELAQLYKDSGKAADSVMNAIDDPSLKMFLNLELKEKLNSEE